MPNVASLPMGEQTYPIILKFFALGGLSSNRRTDISLSKVYFNSPLQCGCDDLEAFPCYAGVSFLIALTIMGVFVSLFLFAFRLCKNCLMPFWICLYSFVSDFDKFAWCRRHGDFRGDLQPLINYCLSLLVRPLMTCSLVLSDSNHSCRSTRSFKRPSRLLSFDWLVIWILSASYHCKWFPPHRQIACLCWVMRFQFCDTRFVLCTVEVGTMFSPSSV